MKNLRLLALAVLCLAGSLAPIGCFSDSQMQENGGNGPDQKDFREGDPNKPPVVVDTRE